MAFGNAISWSAAHSFVARVRHAFAHPSRFIFRTHARRDRSGSSSDIVLCVHGELAALESEWKGFERRVASTTFQCFDWLAKRERLLGPARGSRPAVVLGRDRYGQLLLILQLAIVRRGP